MADVNIAPAPRPTASPVLREEELKHGVDLLTVAVRELGSEGDTLLRAQGLGRAHARVLDTIRRRPSLSVADLLAWLKITKQSLNRVLNDLIAKAYVEQRPSPSDRRKRLLQLTEKGRALDTALWDVQRARVAKAFCDAGPEAVSGFRKVLSGLAEGAARSWVNQADKDQSR